MIENLGLIRDRISTYNVVPDRQFRTTSGFTVQEESVTQKLRQYWADDSISNADKLQGFDLDLKDFDPRSASYKELSEISRALTDLGIIDHTTASGLRSAACEFDEQGNQINMDKKVDVFEYFDMSLEFLKKHIAEGHDFAKDTLTKLNLDITVMLALQERAELSRSSSMINTKA